MTTPSTLVQQGTLNRLLTQLAFSSYPALNVTSGYMTKRFVTCTFEGAEVTQQETGTGIVNSPEPYLMANFSFGLLRNQARANAWLNQVQLYSVLGTVTGYSDSAALQTITLDNASVVAFDPGGWDGMDPTVNVTIRGVYYINNSIWA